MRYGTDPTAQALGWMSIGLGLAELLMARSMARALGMRGGETLIRAYGVREIATGCGLLMARDRSPWMWGRVAGDALDLATLGRQLGNRKAGNVALAMGAVAGVTAVDVACVRQLGRKKTQSDRFVREYSARSGFPRAAAEMRGAASGFEVPREMRAYVWPDQRASARTTDVAT